MKTTTTTAVAAVVLLVAVLCGVVTLKTDRHSKDRHDLQGGPMGTASTQSDDRRVTKRSERVRGPESEFQRYLSKIEPITDFEEPSDGYYQAFLSIQNAEGLLKQGSQASTREAVLKQFEKSYAYFLGIRETAPGWKVQMVLMRLEMTKRSLREAYFAGNTQR